MDGILIIKKEKGYTSHDVVAKVKRIAKTKVGHTGTLDPMATGVLPLLLGEGTKLSKYLIEHDKIYEATVQLGQKTDTADTEGQIIEEKEVNVSLLTKQNIEAVLKQLEGKQTQTPPIYSAIKVKGKKLYEYARSNQEVDIPKREIEIYEINLLKCSIEEKTITFKVHCSKGTYIRSLCETIAQKLETVGYMKELNRIKVGNFSIEQAITLAELEGKINKDNEKIVTITVETTSTENIIENLLEKHVITIEKFFKDKPKIILKEQKLKLFLNGVNLSKDEIIGIVPKSQIYRIYNEQNSFIGIGTFQNDLLKRDIIVK